ncbi:transcriptional regulator [Sphaerochaeta pleomorpha str. Grapes]|uniref:Transcriptional regulator n=1 Tax=Sphaerochaeta pleomorpha (strain ATCC BAA-1885 / DSM 22778 / Grapes) TaxID=158190 RepID=G8QRQ8_SPHPG|nr:LacI family DNA-binding transcriptional regulator [Sphaerochaeta pleomorpha]AEV28841.1 transcriptional regulator [Sphaerochaeta pleomorpha str. Grapes]
MGKQVGRAEVAKSAGVSESTVSRALNDSPLISEEIKKKVREQAEILGYFPSRTATLFASNKSFTLGFVVPYYRNIMPFTRPYFPSLLDGLLLGSMDRGYNIGIVFEKHLGKYRTYNELINSHSYDGLVFAITKDDFPELDSMLEHKIPLVLVNNYHDGAASVYARPDKGMALAFEHAVTLGHHSIGYITGDLRFKNGKDRLAVFETLAAQYHLDIQIVEGNFSRSSGFEALSSFGRRPSLVMTASDRQAFGFMQACLEHGIKIPQEISVIGYDNFQLAGTSSPPLTTVDHPITEMGKLAANMVIDMIQKGTLPEQRWVDTGFMIRKSTAVCGGFQ